MKISTVVRGALSAYCVPAPCQVPSKLLGPRSPFYRWESKAQHSRESSINVGSVKRHLLPSCKGNKGSRFWAPLANLEEKGRLSLPPLYTTLNNKITAPELPPAQARRGKSKASFRGPANPDPTSSHCAFRSEHSARVSVLLGVGAHLAPRLFPPRVLRHKIPAEDLEQGRYWSSLAQLLRGQGVPAPQEQTSWGFLGVGS